MFICRSSHTLWHAFPSVITYTMLILFLLHKSKLWVCFITVNQIFRFVCLYMWYSVTPVWEEYFFSFFWSVVWVLKFFAENLLNKTWNLLIAIIIYHLRIVSVLILLCYLQFISDTAVEPLEGAHFLPNLSLICYWETLLISSSRPHSVPLFSLTLTHWLYWHLSVNALWHMWIPYHVNTITFWSSYSLNA